MHQNSVFPFSFFPLPPSLPSWEKRRAELHTSRALPGVVEYDAGGGKVPRCLIFGNAGKGRELEALRCTNT